MSAKAPEIAAGPTAVRLRRSAIIRLALLAFLLFMAIAVFAAAWPQLTAGDQGRLRDRPEFSLYYPGSVLLREGGSGGYSTETWRQLRTDESAAAVLAFYSGRLDTMGWATGGSVSRTTSETKACGWHKDDLVFRLSFWDMRSFSRRYGADMAFGTIYELRMSDRRSTSDTAVCHPKE